jgi:hypothetical protein
MRLALVSLIALTAGAGAYAQTSSPPPPAPAASPPANAPPAAASAPSPPPPQSQPPAPGAAAPGTSPPEAAPTSPPPPPPPPAPPTDPAAIAVLNVVQKICIPAANGGDLAQLAKAAGYRKSGDTWTYRQRDFSLVIDNPGSNPTQCHVEVTHPVDQESPGRPIIVALNDWAGIINGWSLYRNDKSVQGSEQYTTRSWQHTTDEKVESLVFTTRRKADGTPLHSGQDASELIYGVQKVTP